MICYVITCRKTWFRYFNQTLCYNSPEESPSIRQNVEMEGRAISSILTECLKYLIPRRPLIEDTEIVFVRSPDRITSWKDDPIRALLKYLSLGLLS